MRNKISASAIHQRSALRGFIMNFCFSTFIKVLTATGLIFGISACFDFNAQDSSSSMYSIGGTVSGISTGNSIVLQNNGADNLHIDANGSFTFNTQLPSYSSYNITILSFPADQPCAITYGIGTVISDDISNAKIVCGPPFVGKFINTSALETQRTGHTATLLQNGNVLVVGGGGLTTQDYNAAGCRSSAMHVLYSCDYTLPIYRTVLGSLVYTSIFTISSFLTTEQYNHINGTWTTSASLNTARSLHTATLLPNGKVWVVGGVGSNRGMLASSEIYDPTSDTWTPSANLTEARAGHTATLLLNGKILVVGGSTGTYPATQRTSSTELCDITSNTCSTVGSLSFARSGHTATLLPNGKVIVVGGGKGSVGPTSVEIFDPSTNEWSVEGDYPSTVEGQTATLLPDGKVLFAGGIPSPASPPVSTSILYDSETNTWIPAGNMITARAFHTATLLPNGKVLVAGGHTSNPLFPPLSPTITSSAEIFDPLTNAWSLTGEMTTSQTWQTATLLNTGKLLLVGGAIPPEVTPDVTSTAIAQLFW